MLLHRACQRQTCVITHHGLRRRTKEVRCSAFHERIARCVIVHGFALSIDTREIVVVNATDPCLAFGAWGRSGWPGRFPAIYQV
jgi:hypothetical protein